MIIYLKKSEYIRDWYLIEGTGNQACIEGTSQEMLEIAEAIENRTSISFRRCAVYASKTYAKFESPRNSTEASEVSLEEADQLAKEIHLLLDRP
jgi:hypothetical protein